MFARLTNSIYNYMFRQAFNYIVHLVLKCLIDYLIDSYTRHSSIIIRLIV